MTLTKAITLCLNRVGISTSVDDNRDRARQYMSLQLVEDLALVPYWFLDRTTTFKTTLTFTITGASGTFTVGETVTGGTSLETAVVDSHDTTNDLLYVYSESDDFTALETITGGTSAVTATYASAAETRVYSPISGQVSSWWSFYDETNEWPIEIIGRDKFDLLQRDQSDTGNVEAAFIAGLDADTGYPEIELWRTPGTTNETIRVRYRIDISEWTSSNDASDMSVLGVPRSVENVLVFGGAALFLEDEGDEGSAAVERGRHGKAVKAARAQGRQMQGNRRYLPRRKRYDDELIIRIGTDQVSAA